MEVVPSSKHARSRACLACQKRKGKCDGNDPCSYCTKAKLECAYTTAKKRGPAPKKVKIGKFSIFASASEECQFIPEINVIQDEMTKLYQKNNCIDFYFHFVGHVFPVSQRIRLYTRPRKSSRKVQLYVIFAHVARVFGAQDLSTKCIEEARSYAGEAFDDVSMDSAVAFVMMSLYLGMDDPRGKYYASMAYNILKFPAVGAANEVKEILRTVSFLGLMQEPNMSFDERFDIIVSGLATEQGTLTLKEWLTVINTKIASIYKWKIVKNDAQESLSIGIFCDSSLLSQETSDLLAKEVSLLEDLLQTHGHELGDNLLFNEFLLNYGRLVLAWKTGDRVKAVAIARETSLKIIRDNQTLLVWMLNYFPNMLCLSAILDAYGYPDEAAELASLIEEQCNRVNHRAKFDKLTQAWKVNGKLLKPQIEEILDESPPETSAEHSSPPSHHLHTTTTTTKSSQQPPAPPAPLSSPPVEILSPPSYKLSPSFRYSVSSSQDGANEKIVSTPTQPAIPISPSVPPPYKPALQQVKHQHPAQHSPPLSSFDPVKSAPTVKQDSNFQYVENVRKFEPSTYGTSLPNYQDMQQYQRQAQLASLMAHHPAYQQYAQQHNPHTSPYVYSHLLQQQQQQQLQSQQLQSQQVQQLQQTAPFPLVSLYQRALDPSLASSISLHPSYQQPTQQSQQLQQTIQQTTHQQQQTTQQHQHLHQAQGHHTLQLPLPLTQPLQQQQQQNQQLLGTSTVFLNEQGYPFINYHTSTPSTISISTVSISPVSTSPPNPATGNFQSTT